MAWCAPTGYHYSSSDDRLPEKSFRTPLVGIIAFLSGQCSLRQEMGSTGPEVSKKRCFLLGSATSWLVRHGERVSNYMALKQPALSPTAKWWALAARMKNFMHPVDQCLGQFRAEELYLYNKTLILTCLLLLKNLTTMSGPSHWEISLQLYVRVVLLLLHWDTTAHTENSLQTFFWRLFNKNCRRYRVIKIWWTQENYLDSSRKDFNSFCQNFHPSSLGADRNSRNDLSKTRLPFILPIIFMWCVLDNSLLLWISTGSALGTPLVKDIESKWRMNLGQ